MIRRLRVALLIGIVLASGLGFSTSFGQTSPFVDVVGFAAKTGYRGVFAWQASSQVIGVVHYGTDPANLNLTATQYPVPEPDTAAMAVVHDLEIGRTYYFQVEDEISGAKSEVKSFRAANAYTDWDGSIYTIDMLVQLDSESLPPDIPADLALENIAAGMNVFAERLYDALDGYVRIGQVLITDTNLDYSANTPSTGPPECESTGGNLSDVLVTTSVPFDSHTFGGWAIEDPCISFYLGRAGQLIVPWENDLHLGYVAAHEMLHYAFNAPDLYDVNDITQDEPDYEDDTPWCKNLDWDGSLMLNTGGYAGGRWELTELDRNPNLTPCDHAEEPWSWDALRERYLNVPLNPNGPIDHIVDTKPRGNEDGGALSIRILDREPATSTLTVFAPDDGQTVQCTESSPQVVDQEGDATGVLVEGPLTPNEPSLDVLQGFATWDSATTSLTFTIEVDDLGPLPPPGATGHLFRYYFRYFPNETDYQLQLRREGATASFSLRLADNTVVMAGLQGSFDVATDLISVTVPTKSNVSGAPANYPEWEEKAELNAFEILAQRLEGAVTPTSDIGRGVCPYFVGMGASGPNTPPIAVGDVASTDEDSSVTIDVLANDSDPDGDFLAISAVGSGSFGRTEINTDRTVKYIPNENFNGSDSFLYAITDGRGGVTSARVRVTVHPLPDPPDARDDDAVTTVGTPVEINVLSNDLNDRGDLTISKTSAPTHGTVSCAEGRCTYTPGEGFEGLDSFTYTVSAQGMTDTARVNVYVLRAECLGAQTDDLEPTPEMSWTFSDENGNPLSPTWTSIIDPLAKSPTHSFFSDSTDVSFSKDDRLVAPSFTALPNTQVKFFHRFFTESGWDGGVLEVSIDGGATWHDVTSMGGVFLQGGYNEDITPTNDIAISGKRAWSGTSSGFPNMTEVVLSLGSLTGKQVTLRWRLVTDTNLGFPGWWVDDITFQNFLTSGCVLPTAVEARTADPAAGPLAATGGTWGLMALGMIFIVASAHLWHRSRLRPLPNRAS